MYIALQSFNALLYTAMLYTGNPVLMGVFISRSTVPRSTKNQLVKNCMTMMTIWNYNTQALLFVVVVHF